MLFRIWALVTVFLFSFSAFAFAEKQGIDVGVVKVGSLVINQFEVDRRVQKLIPMQLSFHGSLAEEKKEQIKKKALNELIDRAYKVQYAIAEEISVDGGDFEKEWQKVLSKKPQLKDPSIAHMVSKLRADLYLDFLADAAEKSAVDSKVLVNDDDVKAFYEENKKMYFRPKLFTVSHVFIKVDPSTNKEEREKKKERAQKLYERAVSGEDFYNLAYYESEDKSKYVGGSLGTFHRGETISEFDSVIKDMNPGEIVGPVLSRFGYHIIKLDGYEDERQLAFDEVAEKIRTKLKSEERSKIYKDWMASLSERFVLEYLK